MFRRQHGHHCCSSFDDSEAIMNYHFDLVRVYDFSNTPLLLRASISTTIMGVMQRSTAARRAARTSQALCKQFAHILDFCSGVSTVSKCARPKYRTTLATIDVRWVDRRSRSVSRPATATMIIVPVMISRTRLVYSMRGPTPMLAAVTMSTAAFVQMYIYRGWTAWFDLFVCCYSIRICLSRIRWTR